MLDIDGEVVIFMDGELERLIDGVLVGVDIGVLEGRFVKVDGDVDVIFVGS